MIDPARMERIWAKERGLCPVGLAWVQDSAQGCDVFWHWAVHTEDATDETVAALIRDACVWWLAAQYPEAINCENQEGRWFIVESDRIGRFMADDPTEALLLAVEQALGLPEWKA